MKERKMTGQEMYSMIDLDKNGVCEIKELEDVIMPLGDFSKKEIKSIHDFFDINKDGKVEQSEFLS